jgi:hypothetical protein
VDTAYYVASGSISHFKYDMCLKASFNDMPGIRELWAALRASALRRKKRWNLDDVEMWEQGKSRRRAVLYLQLNLVIKVIPLQA